MSSGMKAIFLFLLSVVMISASSTVWAVTSKDMKTIRRFEQVSINMFEPVGATFFNKDSSFDFSVRFVDSPTVNAYADFYDHRCLIIVFTGLWNDKNGLIHRNNDDEFAVILGHEMGHCLARHQDLLIETISDRLNAIRKRGERPSSQNFTESFLEIMALSRDFENEADYLGIQFMKKAGYNPWAAIGIWKRAAKQSGQNNAAFYLRKHPSSAGRAERIQRTLEAEKRSQEKEQNHLFR